MCKCCIGTLLKLVTENKYHLIKIYMSSVVLNYNQWLYPLKCMENNKIIILNNLYLCCIKIYFWVGSLPLSSMAKWLTCCIYWLLSKIIFTIDINPKSCENKRKKTGKQIKPSNCRKFFKESNKICPVCWMKFISMYINIKHAWNKCFFCKRCVCDTCC